MLIVWGHFAQTLELRALLEQVPIPQKTVQHSPAAKLLTLLLGLLSGIEYLTDLSTGAAPLCKDAAVAAAWDLDRLASASGVSRLLAACDAHAQLILQRLLDEVAQPFLDRAVAFRLEDMAGYRNILVHAYTATSPEVTARLATEGLADLAELAARFAACYVSP
jgi:hypothetical protein